ncbi:MAG TPA: thioredoxin family protein [Candidatus Methylomirabilis sp.]|nr:thioredoxin family protein [Candidatus Methylomirabilis sp.]
MKNHQVVSREVWLVARKGHLAKEKALTRLRDRLSRERRELPWVKVEIEYLFEGPNGRETLADLFEGRSQLLVYHFMFDPSWREGCKSCSFWADNYNDIIVHLNHRDVTMVTVSRAPLPKLEAFKQRMGWGFKWVSSLHTDFNRDYHVSFTPEERETGEANYNYRLTNFPSSEGPGVSVFYKDQDGNVFHTYSCYARGLDMVNGAYHLLDLVPKGRDEEGPRSPMAWLRHHDSYDA